MSQQPEPGYLGFTAIDVETANADMSSICQIGLARCEGGAIVDTWSNYIDPEDDFSPVNISIHGTVNGRAAAESQ